MPRDWKGGTASTFKTIGASNHCDHPRADHDYYATEPAATQWLIRLEQFKGPILEPSCGEGYMARELEKGGYEVVSRDIVDRDTGRWLISSLLTTAGGTETLSPIRHTPLPRSIIPEGHKVAMFLKLAFLEGKRRAAMFNKYPPRRVWVSRARLKCAINGDFANVGGSVTAYAWFVWEKGFHGAPEIYWFN